MEVEFEDQNNYLMSTRLQYQTANKSSLLVKYNIAKDEKSAEKIMMGVMFIILIATGAMFLKLYQNNKPKAVKYNLPDSVIKKLPLNIQEKILWQ